MKLSITNSTAGFCLIAFLVAMAAPSPARCQETARTGQAIPLIQMDRVPLKDAIRNLARQAGRNVILDPRLCCPWIAADASKAAEPSITVRWENLTAEQALGRVVTEQGLVMVTNPATTIARIAYPSQLPKPVPASVVGADTNPVIPLIVMDSVPLPDAIRHLARQGQLRLAEDPSSALSSSAPGSRPAPACDVSLRLENVTARQALAALLDNYDLALVEDSPGSSARIIPRPQTPAGKPPQPK